MSGFKASKTFSGFFMAFLLRGSDFSFVLFLCLTGALSANPKPETLIEYPAGQRDGS